MVMSSNVLGEFAINVLRMEPKGKQIPWKDFFGRLFFRYVGLVIKCFYGFPYVEFI